MGNQSGECGKWEILTVNAGLHCSFKISRQMLPWEFTLGWYTLVLKFTFGGLNG